MKRQTDPPFPIFPERPSPPTKERGAGRLWTGKIQNKSTIAFSILLPQSSSPETNAYFEAMQKAFLSFLSKKSREEKDFVRFGGMNFYEEGKNLVLQVAFGAFESRKFRPLAKISLDEEGNLISLVLF